MNGESPSYGTCPTCGLKMFPVLSLPPCGHDAHPSVVPLDSPGVVYSWTRVWSTPETSRLMAMVDFFKGDLRITAPLVDADAVAIGTRVRAITGDENPIAFEII